MRRARPLDSATPGRFGRKRLTGVGVAAVALLLTCPNVAAQYPDEQPTITEVPKISGIPRDGETLTAGAGDWKPPGATPTYQWLRCNAAGQLDTCREIGGAGTTAPAPYTVVDLDVEHALRIRLTVKSGNDTDSEESAPTAPVVPRAPSNTGLPTVNGTARDGEVMSASAGEWIGTLPLSFDYQWQRCGPSGSPCTPVAGATNPSYVLSSADVGLTVRVRVTASNAGGRSTAQSAPTSVVAPSPLVNLEPPAIVGVSEVEQSVTALPGRWTTSGRIDFLYRWLRCRGDRSECGAIPGATGRIYEVRLVDVGHRLRIRVTAIADAGSSTAESEQTPVVPAPPGAQDFTQAGASPAGAAFMRPFPRVRIKGFYTSAGAVLQLVTVKGPEGTRIRLVCRGRSCPFRRRTLRGHPRVRLRSLERFHPADTRVEIRVTSAGLIGKYTRIIIRAKRPPTRRDRCLMPGSAAPVRCPVRS
jgi:hypothetical protein